MTSNIDISSVISLAFPVIFIILGIALIWMLVELVLTVRKARSTIDDVHGQVKASLENVEEITASLKPVAAKIDPLVERVSLTVDAANLEIMRLDRILEDVGEVTDGMSNAVTAIDAVTSAPREVVASVSSRVRDAFKPRRASDESIALGEQRAQRLREAEDTQDEKGLDGREGDLSRFASEEAPSEKRTAAGDAVPDGGEAASDVAETLIDAADKHASGYFTYRDADAEPVEKSGNDEQVPDCDAASSDDDSFNEKDDGAAVDGTNDSADGHPSA